MSIVQEDISNEYIFYFILIFQIQFTSRKVLKTLHHGVKLYPINSCIINGLGVGVLWNCLRVYHLIPMEFCSWLGGWGGGRVLLEECNSSILEYSWRHAPQRGPLTMCYHVFDGVWLEVDGLFETLESLLALT